MGTDSALLSTSYILGKMDLGESKRTQTYFWVVHSWVRECQRTTVSGTAAGRSNFTPSIIMHVLTHLVCISWGRGLTPSFPLGTLVLHHRATSFRGWLWHHLASWSIVAMRMCLAHLLLQGMELNQGPNYSAFKSTAICTMTPLSKGCSLPMISCGGRTPFWET